VKPEQPQNEDVALTPGECTEEPKTESPITTTPEPTTTPEETAESTQPLPVSTEEIRVDLRRWNITDKRLAEMVQSGEIPQNVTYLDLRGNQIKYMHFNHLYQIAISPGRHTQTTKLNRRATMFFDKNAETMPRNELETLQLERLKKTAQLCYEKSPLYKRKFDSAGLKPENIKTLSDLKNVPFTLKEDFRENYPFGMFTVPMKEILRLHASSGTTGKPTVVGYTRKDLEIWSDCVARLIVAVGTTDNDIAQVAFGYGLFTGALGLHYALEKVGASIIPISSGNTEKQVMLMRDFGTTVLIATPSYALHIGEIAAEMGASKDLKLRLGLFGSEGCTEEMRSQVEKTLGLFATDNYGMSEVMGPGVSGECEYRRGLHFNEDHFLPEIINPDTGEILPEGEKGELVITTLTKEGLPVLRYRTRDITRLTYEKCQCGRTHARMDKTTGRTDDMLKIRGVNVFPSQIESVIMTIEQVAPYYELVVDRDGAHDSLEVKVELVDGSVLESYAGLEALRAKIRHDLKTVLGLDVRVSLVEPKSLVRHVGKAKRVVDNRKK